jgi:hypothetical protein
MLLKCYYEHPDTPDVRRVTVVAGSGGRRRLNHGTHGRSTGVPTRYRPALRFCARSGRGRIAASGERLKPRSGRPVPTERLASLARSWLSDAVARTEPLADADEVNSVPTEALDDLIAKAVSEVERPPVRLRRGGVPVPRADGPHAAPLADGVRPEEAHPPSTRGATPGLDVTL